LNQDGEYEEEQELDEVALYPDTDNMTYEELLELGERIGKVCKGLSPTEIEVNS
jgi:hypothetical protein